MKISSKKCLEKSPKKYFPQTLPIFSFFLFLLIFICLSFPYYSLDICVVFAWIQLFPSISFEYLLMGRILYVVSFEAYFVASIFLLAGWCIKNSFSKVNLTFVLGEFILFYILLVIICIQIRTKPRHPFIG